MQDTNPLHPECSFDNLDTSSASDGDSSLQLAKYELIKTLALHQLQYKMINALSILWNTVSKCQLVFRKAQLSYGFFEWSIEHLLERRKHTLEWLKLLMIRTPMVCLNIRKMEIDLEELVKFIKVMFGDYMQDRSTTGIDKLIRSAVKFIQYEEDLTKELQRHSRRFNTVKNRCLAMTFIQITEYETKASVRAYTIYRALRNCAQARYKSAYEDVVKDQTEMYCNDKEEKLQQAIDRMRIRVEKEMAAGRGTMDMNFTAIQSYREHIEQMRHKYDVEYVKWDAEVAYKRSIINKYRVRMDFLKAQLQWYKEMATSPKSGSIPPVDHMLYGSSHTIQTGVKVGERMNRHTEASMQSANDESSARKKSSAIHRKSSDVVNKFHFLKGSTSGLSLGAQPYKRASRRQSVRLDRIEHNKTTDDSSSQQDSLKSPKKKTANAKSSKKDKNIKI